VEGTVLDHPSTVIRALAAYMDVFDPRTGSLIVVGRSGGQAESEPARGLSARIEERAELVRRLHLLDPRKRNVLCLWYMTGLPATEIARRVGVSRVHAYRLRNQALAEIIKAADVEAATERAHARTAKP
jgi:DNA-directed RNA polymerase specialized sigma24 family protein